MSDLNIIEWDITDKDCQMCADRESAGWWGLGGKLLV